MATWRRVLLLATTDGVPLRALWVALIVGTILNAINQGDAMLAHAQLNLAKVALTYVVPFIVSTHGAVSARWKSGV